MLLSPWVFFSADSLALTRSVVFLIAILVDLSFEWSLRPRYVVVNNFAIDRALLAGALNIHQAGLFGQTVIKLMFNVGPFLRQAQSFSSSS
jgi:hypothetical protein